MNKLNEELLTRIKEGKPVDTAMIPGHLSTPKMPDDVFTVIVDTKGNEFKKVIDNGKFFEWIEKVASISANAKAPIENKAIVGSTFVTACESAKGDIERHIQEIDGAEVSGFTWTYGTNKLQSVSLQGKEIQKAIKLFSKVRENAIEPIPAAQGNPNLPDMTNLQELQNYMSGRD